MNETNKKSEERKKKLLEEQYGIEVAQYIIQRDREERVLFEKLKKKYGVESE